MKSLKNLVEVQGVTICSVIHQPRKIIFELFDSLILLGVGGHLVYHGPVDRSERYFNVLGYHLPPGESIADWLIDISSGDLGPKAVDDIEKEVEGFLNKNKKLEKEVEDILNKKKNGNLEKDEESRTENEDDDPESNAVFDSAADIATARRQKLYEFWRKNFGTLSKKKRVIYDAPAPFELPQPRARPSFWRQLGYQLQRLIIVWERNFLTKLVSCFW